MKDEKNSNARWFCERCKKWHKGYPPLNCPKGYEEKKEIAIIEIDDLIKDLDYQLLKDEDIVEKVY